MKKLLTWAVCSIVLLSCNNQKPAEEATTVSSEPAAAPVVATSPTGATFSDAKYAAMVKSGMAKFVAEDVDGFLANYADNVVWQWNNGDSAVGKAAVTDYWKKRFADVIDSIAISSEIYLGITVANPQSIEQPGVWVLSWYMVNAKYKGTGKRMVQWIHTDLHFDANDKIDRVIQYLDRVPIAAAMKK
jgi:hypothetical protein